MQTHPCSSPQQQEEGMRGGRGCAARQGREVMANHGQGQSGRGHHHTLSLPFLVSSPSICKAALGTPRQPPGSPPQAPGLHGGGAVPSACPAMSCQVPPSAAPRLVQPSPLRPAGGRATEALLKFSAQTSTAANSSEVSSMRLAPRGHVNSSWGKQGAAKHRLGSCSISHSKRSHLLHHN